MKQESYLMPVLSPQQHSIAKVDALRRVSELSIFCAVNPDDTEAKTDLMLMEIALAALTQVKVPVQCSCWISCNERMPENENGKYSDPVIALADSGQAFTLSCMGNYWQRTRAFIDSGATKVTHWQPLNVPQDE